MKRNSLEAVFRYLEVRGLVSSRSDMAVIEPAFEAGYRQAIEKLRNGGHPMGLDPYVCEEAALWLEKDIDEKE